MKRQKQTFKILVVIVGLCVSGFYFPDQYEAVLEVNESGDIKYNFNGEVQFFAIGYNPSKKSLSPSAIRKITSGMNSSTPITIGSHLSGKVWKLTLSREIKSAAWPKDLWGEKSVETMRIPEDRRFGFLRVNRHKERLEFNSFIEKKGIRNDLADMGYTSTGILKIVTDRKLTQISGPKLKKSVVRNVYSTRFDWFNDPPLKFTITLNK